MLSQIKKIKRRVPNTTICGHAQTVGVRAVNKNITL